MMERTSGWILGLAVLAGALGGYVQHRALQQPPGDTASVQAIVGQPLPPLALRTLDGQPYALGRYHGQRLLLNFWASWCGPCREEMPRIDQWQQGLGSAHLQVVGIAMDDPTRTRVFLAAHPVSYPNVIGQTGHDSQGFVPGDTRQVLPYSLLLGADGRVLATHAGALSRRQLQAWLQL